MTTPAWLARHLTMPVVIVRRVPNATPDEYGNVVYDEERHNSTGFLGPIAETEIQGGRAEVGTYLLVLPTADASIVDGFCSFEVGGISYEAIGAASVPTSLSNHASHHVEFAVQRSSA
jgi:hypothetical protein